EKAVAFLDEFATHRAQHEPFLREATDKYNRAYLVGVSVPSLRATLHEAWTSLEAAPAAAAAVIQRIDTLTEYSLYQGHDVYIPTMLRNCRDHLAALERLVTALRFQLSELEEKVKHEARRVPPATVLHIPDRSNGVVVQSTFDPRVEGE